MFRKSLTHLKRHLDNADIIVDRDTVVIFMSKYQTVITLYLSLFSAVIVGEAVIPGHGLNTPRTVAAMAGGHNPLFICNKNAWTVTEKDMNSGSNSVGKFAMELLDVAMWQ